MGSNHRRARVTPGPCYHYTTSPFPHHLNLWHLRFPVFLKKPCGGLRLEKINLIRRAGLSRFFPDNFLFYTVDVVSGTLILGVSKPGGDAHVLLRGQGWIRTNDFPVRDCSLARRSTTELPTRFGELNRLHLPISPFTRKPEASAFLLLLY